MSGQIGEEEIRQVMNELETMFRYRLKQHGTRKMVNSHEISGIVTEEYHEFLDAVKSNNKIEVEKELVDVAVAAMFGMASMEK